MPNNDQSLNSNIPTMKFNRKDLGAMIEYFDARRREVEAARRRVEAAERLITDLVQGLVPDDELLMGKVQKYVLMSGDDISENVADIFFARAADGWRLRARACDQMSDERDEVRRSTPLAATPSPLLLLCAGSDEKLESLVLKVLESAADVLSIWTPGEGNCH